MHLVTRGHFRLRDQYGGHTIRSVVAENSMVHANFTALCIIESELFIDDENFTLQKLLLLLFIRTQKYILKRKEKRQTSNSRPLRRNSIKEHASAVEK